MNGHFGRGPTTRSLVDNNDHHGYEPLPSTGMILQVGLHDQFMDHICHRLRIPPWESVWTARFCGICSALKKSSVLRSDETNNSRHLDLLYNFVVSSKITQPFKHSFWNHFMKGFEAEGEALSWGESISSQWKTGSSKSKEKCSITKSEVVFSETCCHQSIQVPKIEVLYLIRMF